MVKFKNFIKLVYSSESQRLPFFEILQEMMYHYINYYRVQQTFSVKAHIVNILGFVGQEAKLNYFRAMVICSAQWSLWQLLNAAIKAESLRG